MPVVPRQCRPTAVPSNPPWVAARVPSMPRLQCRTVDQCDGQAHPISYAYGRRQPPEKLKKGLTTAYGCQHGTRTCEAGNVPKGRMPWLCDCVVAQSHSDRTHNESRAALIVSRAAKSSHRKSRIREPKDHGITTLDAHPMRSYDFTVVSPKIE